MALRDVIDVPAVNALRGMWCHANRRSVVRPRFHFPSNVINPNELHTTEL
jgi:hypothetical protein